MPEQPLTAAELAELRLLLQGPWVHAVAQLRNAAPRLLAAAEEAERLRAALKPFAEYADSNEFKGRPDHWRIGHADFALGFINRQCPTLGDCRRAAEALAVAVRKEPKP